MVTLGTDAHQWSHTVVATDEQGRPVGQLRVKATPEGHLDGVERQVRLLVDHREDLVAERIRAQQRLRWHLHELEPGWAIPAGGLDRAVWLDAVQARLAAHQGVVAEIAGELVARCRELTGRVNQLEQQLRRLVTPLTPTLLHLEGCGALTAAKLVGETAGSAASAPGRRSPCTTGPRRSRSGRVTTSATG